MDYNSHLCFYLLTITQSTTNILERPFDRELPFLHLVCMDLYNSHPSLQFPILVPSKIKMRDDI